MKRFTKISLILSGGFLLLGIVLCLTAYTMGGRVGDLSVSYDSEKHSFVIIELFLIFYYFHYI